MDEHKCTTNDSNYHIRSDCGHWYQNHGGFFYGPIYHCPYCGEKLESPYSVVKVSQQTMHGWIRGIDRAAYHLTRGDTGQFTAKMVEIAESIKVAMMTDHPELP